MDEYVIKQKIQKAFVEPKAPEGLVEKVILRANAVTMGMNAQKALETAPAEKVGELISVHVIARPHTEVDAILPKGRLSQGGNQAAK